MKTLKFEGQEGKKYFDICIGALLVNPKGYSGSNRRCARRIHDKLEAIAKPIEVEGSEKLLVKFELQGDNSVDLEDVEHKLLLETVDGISWTRETVILADNTVLWLESMK